MFVLTRAVEMSKGQKSIQFLIVYGRENFLSHCRKNTDRKFWERKPEDITWLRVKVTKFWSLAIKLT